MKFFPLLLAVVLLCGCERQDSGRIVVTYWEKWLGPEADALSDIVKDFNASQDRIEVRLLPVSQIDVKLLLAVSGGNPPDIAGLWSMEIPDFCEKGALMPLDRLLAENGVNGDRFIPQYWELGRHRGFTWSVPLLPANSTLYYNRTLFREAGLDPNKPPRTLEELDEMSDRLTEVEIFRDGQPVKVSYSDLKPDERDPSKFRLLRAGHLPHEPGWWTPMWGGWFGANLEDGNGRLTLTDPRNVEAFEWMRRTSEKYGVDNLRAFGASYASGGNSQNPFLSGKVAMVLHGAWMAINIQKYAPTLDWDVAAFPASAASGLADVVFIEADSLVIPVGAKHPREAAEFLAYISRQDVAEKLAREMKRFTALREVSPGFVAVNSNPAIAKLIQLANSPNAISVPKIPIWREVDAELRAAADRVRNLKESPADALAEAQARSQWRLDRINRRWALSEKERLEEWRNQ